MKFEQVQVFPYNPEDEEKTRCAKHPESDATHYIFVYTPNGIEPSQSSDFQKDVCDQCLPDVFNAVVRDVLIAARVRNS